MVSAPAALARRRATRNAGVPTTLPRRVLRVTAKPPKITAGHVRKWVADVRPKRGPRWPILPDHVIVAVANACNSERREHALRRQVARDMSEFRGRAQSLRTAVNTVLSELPAIISDGWPTELLHALVDAHVACQRLRGFLDPTRSPGGQRRILNKFACRIATHIRFSLEQQGVKASLKPDRPLVRFVASAISAVFGVRAKPDTLALALRRHFDGLKRGGHSD